MARDCRKKTEYLQINQTSGWFDTDTKGKPSTGKGKGEQDKGKGKDKLGKGKYSSKNSEKDNNTARKGRTDLTRWRGTKTRKKPKPVKKTQSGRTRVGMTLTIGRMKTAGRFREKETVVGAIHVKQACCPAGRTPNPFPQVRSFLLAACGRFAHLSSGVEPAVEAVLRISRW